MFVWLSLCKPRGSYEPITCSEFSDSVFVLFMYVKQTLTAFYERIVVRNFVTFVYCVTFDMKAVKEL